MKQLFEPYLLKENFELKNRLVMAPMTTWSSHDDGQVSEEELAYYKARSGGAGMVITATTYTEAHGKGFKGQFYAGDDTMMPSLKRLAKTIKFKGAKAILQVFHAGRKAETHVMPDGKTRSASAVQANREENNVPVAMTLAEIQNTITSYYHVTHRAHAAGFDGVEIHGANTYLIQQFYSPHANIRSDEWGGSREKRLNLPLEIVEACLKAKYEINDPGFIVGYRFSPEENHTPGITMEDTKVLVDALCDTDLDYLHISLKDYKQYSIREDFEHGMTLVHLIDYIQNRKPVMGVGSVTTAQKAQEVLDFGADMVALGRQLLVDAKTIEKWQQGQEARQAYDPSLKTSEAMTDPLETFIFNCNGWVPVKE